MWALHEPHVLRQPAQSRSAHPTHFMRHFSHVLAEQSAQVSPHTQHSLVTDTMRGHELHSTMQALHLFSSVLNEHSQQHSMQHTLLQAKTLFVTCLHITTMCAIVCARDTCGFPAADVIAEGGALVAHKAMATAHVR